MFTGIIETIGEVVSLEQAGNNITFEIRSSLAPELKIDQSVAHNGCCLTVIAIQNDCYKVTAIQETLEKTNLKMWKPGTRVNLERCMQLGGRLDGHLVQGHVDTTAKCTQIQDFNGSIQFTFEYEANYPTVSKGSITVNGVSLTVVESKSHSFSVCIIPYTLEHTNFHTLNVGDLVNLEFDILGKYVAKLLGKE
jgi:riboflavin synthase